MMKLPMLIAALSVAASSLFADPLFQSNDRIAIIGNTVVERSRLYGHVETALQVAAGPEAQNLVFRNLGWSADSVFGDSRSYFGPPQEGRDRLDTNLGEIKPTIVFLVYGTGAAMSVNQGWTLENGADAESANGLDSSKALFAEGYQALVDRVKAAAGNDLRTLVFVAPPPLENLGEPLPDQAENNQRLAAFRYVIRERSEKNGCIFVDLFAALGGDDFNGEVATHPLTNNGVHYTEAGYRVIARELVKGLGYDESIVSDPDEGALTELRNQVVEKNRLFFNRWRPANETYLFLFRAHEQGQNAKEIPMFDPMIEKEEAKIAQLRKQVLAGGTAE